jgi:NAD(P)-dependent dehydrogenase (short-subunit alcohol dehydrogenase family)
MPLRERGPTAAPDHHVIAEPPPFASPPLPADMLAGQVALVSGGGSGMGLSMATALAQAGAAIVTMGRSIERAEEGAASIRALGGRALAVSADVRDPAQIAAAFDRAEAELGPVSILANNAGANFPVLAEAMSPNAWRAVTRIAIDGTFFCSTEFARRRIAAGKSGAIVNNSAQYVWTGFAGDAHSAAAKSAIVTMTAALARDWKAHAIRVNCVAAGFFPHASSISGEGPEAPDRIPRIGMMIPAGRTGRIYEFGWSAAFLCSPLAAGITGETLVIDGADRLRRILMQPDFVPPRERATIWGEVP